VERGAERLQGGRSSSTRELGSAWLSKVKEEISLLRTDEPARKWPGEKESCLTLQKAQAYESNIYRFSLGLMGFC